MNVGEAIAIALVCLILGYALVSRLFRIVRGLSHLPRSLQLLMGSHSVKNYLEKEKPTESDVKITPTAEPGWLSPAPHIGALFGGVLVFIGVFLPWIQLGTLLTNRGIDNPDGAIVLAFSLIVITAAGYGLASRRTWLGVVYLLCAAVLFWVGVADIGEVQSRVQEARGTMLGEAISAGAGLYVVLVGAVITGISGLIALIGASSARETKEEKPVQGAYPSQLDLTLRDRNPSGEIDIASQLEKLADLRSKGMLTEEEYTRAKAKLLRDGKG